MGAGIGRSFARQGRTGTLAGIEPRRPEHIENRRGAQEAKKRIPSRDDATHLAGAVRGVYAKLFTDSYLPNPIIAPESGRGKRSEKGFGAPRTLTLAKQVG